MLGLTQQVLPDGQQKLPPMIGLKPQQAVPDGQHIVLPVLESTQQVVSDGQLSPLLQQV